MKTMKKMMVLVLSVLMVLGTTMVTAFAAAPETGTITIKTPSEVGASEEVTYQIYKIFDAKVNATTGAVTYKLMEGATTAPEGFTANSQGYITDAPTALVDTTTAFEEYSAKKLVDTVKITGPSTEKASKELEPGYYYVKTSTGAAVMVMPGGNVKVDDKNELSTIVKSLGSEYDEDSQKAIDAVGTEQDFTIVVTKKHGATKLEVADTMVGMELTGPVTVVDVDDENYTATGAAGDASFSVVFDTDFVKGLADDTELTITYTAKITSDALQADPATNTAELTTDNNHKITTDVVEVYNAKITINKVDEEGEPLEGAGFTLYDEDGEAVGDEITGVTEFVWSGLPAGTYTVKETTVPEGYNVAEDVEFTIEEDDFTEENLSQSATVENKEGAELPSTGGMGTTILYIIGGALVVVCGIMLVAKKRTSNK